MVERGFFVSDTELDRLGRDYLDALLDGDRPRAARLVLDAVEAGMPVHDVYMGVFQPAQYEVGRLWQKNRISVAQEHYCTAATQFVMSQLYPYIFGGERTGRTLVACCVGGELHELGMRMVSDFFEMDGWDTYYLGANMPAPDVAGAVAERGADLLGVSVTMTFNVHLVRLVVDAVRAEPGAKDARILVGGYPFLLDADLWRDVGADGFAADAVEAVVLGKRLVGEG